MVSANPLYVIDIGGKQYIYIWTNYIYIYIFLCVYIFFIHKLWMAYIVPFVSFLDVFSYKNRGSLRSPFLLQAPSVTAWRSLLMPLPCCVSLGDDRWHSFGWPVCFYAGSLVKIRVVYDLRNEIQGFVLPKNRKVVDELEEWNSSFVCFKPGNLDQLIHLDWT